MNKLYCTLLISPPGGGKSTWLKSHKYDLVFDDMSLLENGIKNFSEKIEPGYQVAIADINFCDFEILKKAWDKLSNIAKEKNLEIEFKHILFMGEKENYFKNVESRQDGRNVAASIIRFYPHIKKLVNIDIGKKEIIEINKYKRVNNKFKLL